MVIYYTINKVIQSFTPLFISFYFAWGINFQILQRLFWRVKVYTSFLSEVFTEAC